jgi:hypothetical protein
LPDIDIKARNWLTVVDIDELNVEKKRDSRLLLSHISTMSGLDVIWTNGCLWGKNT